MKKLKKLLCAAFMIVAVGLVCAGCSIIKDVGIKSIQINSEQTVVQIYAGEFDEANITATVTYEDDTTKTIQITEDMVVYNDGPSSSQWVNTPGTYAITVLFKGETVSLTVKVLPKLITVKFYNGYGSVISQQTIQKGGSATAPNDGYEMNGMYFIGWDRTFTNLTEDTAVYACYGSVTSLNIEQNLDGWQYRVRYSEQGNTYNFYKFADGKIYYYTGDLASFLYLDKSSIAGVDYTAVYTAEVRDNVVGYWLIKFKIDNITHNLYYDNMQLGFMQSDASVVYFGQLKDKYALQLNVWYKWETGETDVGSHVYGYIRVGSNAKVEYYSGTSLPDSNENITYLSYTANINDSGLIEIAIEETSQFRGMTICCGENIYIVGTYTNLTVAN